MKKKTFPPRRSSTFLRRIASAALLMLTFHTAAMAITVTLKPGRGSGSDIVIYSEIEANMAASMSSAANGQFWLEGSELWFNFPDCPSSFTAPVDEVLIGWTVDSEDGSTCSPGTQYHISKNLTLYAQWGLAEFTVGIDDVIYKCAITNSSPREVSLIEISGSAIYDISIPASVEYYGEEYAVTGIADGLCYNKSQIHTLSIPATVRHIGEKFCKECFNLNTVSFELRSQLESIGQKSFCDCYALTSVYGLPVKINLASGDFVFSNTAIQNITLQGHGVLQFGILLIVERMSSYQWILPSNEYDGYTWTTFYSALYNFQADDATTVYKAELVGNTLLLHEVQDRIINSYTPVILKSTGYPVLTNTDAESTDNSPNNLLGCESDEDTSPVAYVLYGGEEGIGFYPNSGEKMNPGTAYVDIWPDMGEYDFVGMTETPNIGTTAIPSMPAQEAGQDEAAPWFTIDGRRLHARPARPGIYIRSGRKAVIR